MTEFIFVIFHCGSFSSRTYSVLSQYKTTKSVLQTRLFRALTKCSATIPSTHRLMWHHRLHHHRPVVPRHACHQKRDPNYLSCLPSRQLLTYRHTHGIVIGVFTSPLNLSPTVCVFTCVCVCVCVWWEKAFCV